MVPVAPAPAAEVRCSTVRTGSEEESALSGSPVLMFPTGSPAGRSAVERCAETLPGSRQARTRIAARIANNRVTLAHSGLQAARISIVGGTPQELQSTRNATPTDGSGSPHPQTALRSHYRKQSHGHTSRSSTEDCWMSLSDTRAFPLNAGVNLQKRFLNETRHGGRLERA
jgi:hypothetical protein